MIKKKNKKTLKRRMQRAMSLSTLITVLFLSGVIIYLVIFGTKYLAAYQAEAVGNMIQKEINSGDILKILNIDSLEELEDNNTDIQIWIDGISRRTLLNDFAMYDSKYNSVCITIELNDKIIYSNDDSESALMVFYQDAEVEKQIYDENGTEIGTIKVMMNPNFIMGFLGPVLGVIIVLSIIVLLISRLISIFLIIPIINPVNKLIKKVRAIAEGDIETAVDTQLTLKKPLREIEFLVDSTNTIMNKLSGYNEILEKQNETLENQNIELEAQNNELIESKLQIQKTQAQLIQSEKMASVGLLTAAITHEINTPIGAINSNVQLEKMILAEMMNLLKDEQDETLKAMLEQIAGFNEVNLMACSRIVEIIRSLKSFSRLDQAEFQEANINEGIQSVLVLTNNLLKNRITIHEEYGELPLVRCFPGQLNQVFMNLIVNAAQAIEGQGDIFINTRISGENVMITIRDTGTGIKKENITKLFEPGFTTKGVGVGLGLGLYISYNIIQNHDGVITVNSEEGKGSEFIIKIPISSDYNRRSVEN